MSEQVTAMKADRCPWCLRFPMSEVSQRFADGPELYELACYHRDCDVRPSTGRRATRAEAIEEWNAMARQQETRE